MFTLKSLQTFNPRYLRHNILSTKKYIHDEHKILNTFSNLTFDNEKTKYSDQHTKYIPEDRLINWNTDTLRKKILPSEIFNVELFKIYPYAIKYISYQYQTQEMVDIILENSDHSLLNYIDPKFIDAERLKKYPYIFEYILDILEYIPQIDQTREMIYAFLENSYNLWLKNINLKFIDVECLKKYPHAIKCIRWENQTREMVNTVIDKNNCSLLTHVNPKFINMEWWKKHPNTIQDVAFEFQNLEIATTVFSVDNSLVRFIAPRLRTNEMKKYSIDLFKKTDILNDLEGTVMMGNEFNDLMKSKNKTFVKMLRSDGIHNGLHLKEGLNEDPNIFDPDCNCCPGGIYFSETNNKYKWLGIHTHARKVIVPNDAVVKIEWDKIKATSIILGEIDTWIIDAIELVKNKDEYIHNPLPNCSIYFFP